jgi:sialic acid synthase
MKSIYEAPKVIAEIGCNHKEKIEIAKQLLKVAVESGDEVVEFTKKIIMNS